MKFLVGGSLNQNLNFCHFEPRNLRREICCSLPKADSSPLKRFGMTEFRMRVATIIFELSNY